MNLEPNLRGSIAFMAYWQKKNWPGQEALRGLEVGVYNGVHASTMLTLMRNLEHLYLVDPYMGNFAFARDNGIGALSIFGNRKTWIHKCFRDCTPDDIPEMLDFVYVDGDHSYTEVLRDIKNAVRFVKQFGVIGGHDLQMEGVRHAVEEYCADNSRELRTIGGEWWFINGDINDEQRRCLSAFNF